MKSHLFPLVLILVGWTSLAADGDGLWPLARRYDGVHRFSTLFTAQDVRDFLGNEKGMADAIGWCRATAVTKVYVEVFRDGYQAERTTLVRARDRLREAGLEVSGCVTTTRVGKNSSRWEIIACYTDPPTQDRVQAIFEYAASLFDEVMIDDFWFTDCACAECDRARVRRVASVGSKAYPVAGDTFEDYRRELMVRVSQDRVLGPARKVNPRVRLIIKYPQWYDMFHERGYDVVQQTADFDRIWVGTETRDYADARWGGTVPYEAYFIMRWLGGIGGRKCGGGWYDWLGTTERTYVEQARQTVLAGARESLLFCYGGLLRDTGPKDIAALRTQIPELLEVAAKVKGARPVGLAAYKPANSHPEEERRVFDFVGMLGLPLVPCHKFPAEAPAAFFSVHALKDPGFRAGFEGFVRAGKPVLVTDGLAKRLGNLPVLGRPNVHVLKVGGEPKSLLSLGQAQLDALREPLLKPLRTRFAAPSQVGLYLFRNRGWVIENFNDQPVEVQLNGRSIQVPARGWVYEWGKRT